VRSSSEEARSQARLRGTLARGLLLVGTALFAWVRFDEADLPGYDDAYYARKALEVARSGDWLGLPFNGSPTYDNPPLGIWSMAVVFLLAGPGDAAARIPSGVYGVLSALLAFEWILRRSGSRGAALLGAALVVCNPLFLKYLRRAMLDVGALFWCLLGLLLAEWRPLSRYMQLLAGVAFGCAFLTKSVLPLTVPVAMVAGWWLEGEEGRRRLAIGWGPLLAGFSLTAGGWLAAMWVLHGKPFVGGHFVWLLWREGVLAASDSARLQTAAHLFAALLPLSLALSWAVGSWTAEVWSRATGSPAVEQAAGQRPGAWRGIAAPILLAAVPLAAVMAVGARKIWYFMPALPGMAAVAALRLWGRAGASLPAERRLLGGVAAVWMAGAAAIALLTVPLHRDRTSDARALAAELRSRTPPGTPLTLHFPGETCRWDLRNAILWYSDRPVRGCAGESSADLAMGVGGARWVLTTARGALDLAAAGLATAQVVQRGGLVLARASRPAVQEPAGGRAPAFPPGRGETRMDPRSWEERRAE
jgi:4-amino-4-deoxy-L-arabinose transferase-like glycosyltransferase